MLTALVQPYLSSESPPMATLACPLTDEAAWDDPNVVKVVCDPEASRPVSFRRPRSERGPRFPRIAMQYFLIRSWAGMRGKDRRVRLDGMAGTSEFPGDGHGEVASLAPRSTTTESASMERGCSRVCQTYEDMRVPVRPEVLLAQAAGPTLV
jgi:hypothetical protein